VLGKRKQDKSPAIAVLFGMLRREIVTVLCTSIVNCTVLSNLGWYVDLEE